MTEPVAAQPPTTTSSISERILLATSNPPNPNNPPLKSSTTVSTIVVQSGETRIVIALLKSADTVEFKILEMNPKLTDLGSEVHESEQMLTDHETVVTKLEKKQTPVEDLIRQVEKIESIENSDVYVAMAICLAEAWSDLTSKLGVRTEVLSFCHSFHGYRQDCLDSFRKYDNSSRRETLINYSKAVDTGNKLIDKLRTLEDSWESILRVNYWLDDLRQAMLDWKAELQRLETKEKEAKTYQEYLDELANIKNRLEEYSVIRTELMSMFTRIDDELKLTAPKKTELDVKVYEVLQDITNKVEALETVKLFLEESNELAKPHFTEDYLEKLESVKGLDEELCAILQKRLKIREEYDNILETVCDNDTLDEESVKEKLSKDETLDIASALENINRKFHRHQLGVYELFKERIEIIEGSIKEGGELQDYLLLDDIVQEVDMDVKNAKDFNRKDEISQKCKNLTAIIQHRTSILQDVKKFINENKDLSDDAFRVEHIKTLRRLTDSKDGRILSCILRNRMTVRNVYELILKSPLDYEEDEIAELISVSRLEAERWKDQTLETEPALEKIMARRRLLELLKTLDFPLPENLATAKSDLVDFASFEDMVESLPDPPEELVQKTNAKKDKILKCIQFYELLEQLNETPEQLELLAALETELFGTTHWSDFIPKKNVDEKADNAQKLESLQPPITNPARTRDSLSADTNNSSIITRIEVLSDGEIILLEEDRASTATPSLNLSETDTELFMPTESEPEDRYETPHSEIDIILNEKLLRQVDGKQFPEKTKETTGRNGDDKSKRLGEICIVSMKQDTGDGNMLGSIQLETITHSQEHSEPVVTTESLKPIQPTHLEVEILKITETPVELQNIGTETQIVQEPSEFHSVETIIPIKCEGTEEWKEEYETKITEVPTELKSIGMETQTVEEPQDMENFVTSHLIEAPDSDDEILNPKDKSGVQDTQIIEEPSESEAIVVNEPLELKIGKQTVIIEEPEYTITDIEEEKKDLDVRVVSEEPESTLAPKSVTLVRTITQSKMPHELEAEKVEALLAELEELRNLRAEEEKAEASTVSPTPVEDNIKDEEKETPIETFGKLPKISEVDEGKQIDVSRKDNPKKAEKVKDKIPKPDSDLTGNLESKTGMSVEFSQIPEDQLSDKSVNIPVEIVVRNQANPEELVKPKFNELTQFEVRSITANPNLEQQNQPAETQTLGDRYLDDIITVETDTFEFETALQITFENRAAPKEQNTVETQTSVEDFSPKQGTTSESQGNIELKDKPISDNPGGHPNSEASNEKRVSVKTQTVTGTFNINPYDEEVAGFCPEDPVLTKFRTIGSTGTIVLSEEEALKLTKVKDATESHQRESELQDESVMEPRHLVTVENTSQFENFAPEETQKPEIKKKPVVIKPELRTEIKPVEVEEVVQLKNEKSTLIKKPEIKEKPTGLPDIPRKSAFVEIQNIVSPRGFPCGTQTSPVVVKIPSYINSESQTSIDEGKKLGPQPGIDQFANGMTNALLSEVRQRLNGQPISTQTTTAPEIEHPSGLLQIFKAENALNQEVTVVPPNSRTDQSNLEGYKSPVKEMETQTDAPDRFKSPVQESETQTDIGARDVEFCLEGYKSPVQEMETQTVQPPPVLNSETQTVETLKRLDSTQTQTVCDEIKMFNIQTQTSSTNLSISPDVRTRQSEEQPPAESVKVKTEAYYFVPNLFTEILGRGPTAEEMRQRQVEPEQSSNLGGTSDRVQIFENISQTAQIPISISVSATRTTDAEKKPQNGVFGPVPINQTGEISSPVTRMIEIKIPPELQRSPQMSPYSPFTNDSGTPELQSPSLYRTPTPKSGRGETREIPIQYSTIKDQPSTPDFAAPTPREKPIPIQVQQVSKIPPPPRMPDDPSTPSLYPWRKPSLEVADRPAPAPPTVPKLETVSYTFGHFEETKETIPSEKQPSVRDRVKYWEPRTSLSEQGQGPNMDNVRPEIESKPQDKDKVTFSGDTKWPDPDRVPGMDPQHKVIFESANIAPDLTEESVANAIEERRKELAEYQHRGTVSNYRKLFQSYEQTSMTSIGGKETRENTKTYQETVQKIPTRPTFERLHSEAGKMFQAFQSSQPENIPTQEEPMTPKERFLQRRHSETISSPAFPKSEESPQEGTVARFKRLFQSFESSGGQESYTKRSEEKSTRIPERGRGRSELVTSPLGFRLSPVFPKREFGEFVQMEESQSRTSSGEWMMENNKYFQSTSREIMRGSPLSPTLRPTKFVPGEFHESDYESDYDCKIPPVWVPPSKDSRPPSSVEFRSITPTVNTIPIKTSKKPSDNLQKFQKDQQQFMKPGQNIKPVPPPKPTAHTIKETSLTSKVTRTEETKFMLRPIRSPQPVSDSDDDLYIRKVQSPTSPTATISRPQTTTRLYKAEELVEKHTK